MNFASLEVNAQDFILEQALDEFSLHKTSDILC